MGINKFIYGGEVKFDLTGDTVTPETLAQGVTAHNSKGERITGTMTTEGGGNPSAGGDNVLRVTGEFNSETMQVENVSHSAVEIITAINSGKTIQCLGLLYSGGAPMWVSFNLNAFLSVGEINVVLLNTLVEMNSWLYYVTVQLGSNSSSGETDVITTLKVISTM